MIEVFSVQFDEHVAIGWLIQELRDEWDSPLHGLDATDYPILDHLVNRYYVEVNQLKTAEDFDAFVRATRGISLQQWLSLRLGVEVA
jgi:hypothetical protein